MKTLVIDTSHKNLVIGCFEDDHCISSINEVAWKRQSERFFPALNNCMEKAHWKSEDIQQVVLTDGPGSYTGERIAMTFAKVLCTQKPIELYTISTFQMYAGLDHAMVILDARSNRAYCGICENGQLIEEGIKNLDEIKNIQNINMIGDVHLIEKETQEIDFVDHFMKVKKYWRKVENIHILTPHYLKSKEELVQ